MSKGLILVVEDNAAIREALLEILQGDGFNTLSAADGYPALEILQQGNMPCWILMDITMPNMGGIDCLEKIRENKAWAEIPVTLLSAAVQTQEQAKNRGVDFLKKPVDIDVLLKAAEKHCR